MRVDLKKWLFVGLTGEKPGFFREAQKWGLIEFIDKVKGPKKSPEKEVHLFLQALKILRSLPVHKQEESFQGDTASLAEKIIHLQKEIDQHEEEIRLDRLEMVRISPLGHFSLEDVKEIEKNSGRVLQFYCGKKGKKDLLKDVEELIYLTSDSALDYFLAIHTQPIAYPGLIEMKISASLDQLHKQVEIAKHKSKLASAQLHVLAKYDTLLHQALREALNGAHLDEAEKKSSNQLEGSLFSVAGWVPETQVATLTTLARHHAVHMEEIAIDEGDRLPTYLENTHAAKIGEDLVAIYDTPSTTDKDPSLWVLASFILYFSIIIGDGGYGLILLAITLYARYKLPRLEGVKKRVLNLATTLSIGCIVWGIATASFFGIAFEPGHSIRSGSPISFLAEKKAEFQRKNDTSTYKKWLIEYPDIKQAVTGKEMIENGSVIKNDVKTYPLFFELSDQVLMEWALVLGVFHLLLGMLRYALKNLTQIGWALFLLGAFLYIPAYLGTPSFVNYLMGVPIEKAGRAGWQMMCVGVPFAVIVSMFRNGWSGLADVMNVIQVFADTLSYLRLYALGLSGAILGSTINEMAAVLPFLPALLLIGAGHAINMSLCLMGGVIHGLRLNFIEWYHYSFEGGGKKFEPLQMK